VLGIGDNLLPRDPPDPSLFAGNAAVVLEWSRPDDVTLLYPGFPLDHLDPGLRFALARTNALATYESLVWSKVSSVQKRLTSSESGGPRNQFGLVSDMQELASTFARDDQGALETWRGKWRHSAWFREIRSLAEQRRAKLAIVVMPMPSAYRAAVTSAAAGTPEAEYREWLHADLSAHGDLLIDLRALLDDSRFGDGLHVDAEGASLFSETLGRALREVL
jgi:hypothetical protein